MLSIVVSMSFLSCNPTQKLNNPTTIEKFTQKVSETELKKQLFILAGDEMQGRNAGTQGERLAADHIVSYYKALGISSAKGTDKPYFQTIPAKTFNRVEGEMRNILAFIPGTEKADEVLVLSAHYDHEGVKNGEIYNGADDNGSGTVAVMEIARVMKMAHEKGVGPKRSILFLHVSGEEKGLLGSKYYTDHPIFPLDKTIANINIDMIGRVDNEHLQQENFVYVIGSDMLSSDLDKKVREATQFSSIVLDEKYNTKDDPNRFYYRSDHYNFAKYQIPSVFYFNGVHEDYHQPSDTPDKINYPVLTQRTKLIFATVWLLANAENRPVVDKISE